MHRPAWSRYMAWMLGTVLVIVTSCAAFNVMVDPLGVFGSPRIAGVNAIKPYLDHHRGLSRWQAAKRECPNAAILGNSRAEIGFDPRHEGFQRHDLRAFNHAIPGSGIATARQQLDWLDAAGCAPRLVIVGVDFFDFLGGTTRPGTQPRPLVPAPRIDATVWAETVFSLSGARESVQTLWVQRARHAAIITPQGFNPLREYEPLVAQSGHAVLFRQRALENLRSWSRKERRLTALNGDESEDVAELKALLAKAGTTATRVHLVIYPYHAQLRLMIERAGLGDLLAEWKTAMLAASRQATTPATTVTLWDFSALSDETTEPIPEPGDRRTQLRYYWEAGHFKKALGDRVLDRVLGGQETWGQPLDPATLDRWLREDRQSVQRRLAEPSALSREVESLFDGSGR